MKRIKNQNRPKQILDTLLAQVYLKNRVQLDTSLHVDRNPKSFPKKRDIAYTDGETICISPKMYSLEIENQIAVLDACEGIVYRNDGQFCQYHVEDWYGKPKEAPHILLSLYVISW